MKLTPKAATAVDIIIHTITTFQQELAPLSAACDVMIDGMMQLKGAGHLAEDMPQRMIAANATIAGLPAASKALEIIGPACDIIAHEIEGLPQT
jgi:hypothetical protein